MNFNDFRIMYADLMMDYQAIEHDLTYIYYFMINNEDKDGTLLKKIKLYSLRKLIDSLKELDNSDNQPYLSSDSYDLLLKLNKHRNHWAHETFQNFMYDKDFIHSAEYKNECKKLKKDYQLIENIYQQVEKIRIEYCIEVASHDKNGE